MFNEQILEFAVKNKISITFSMDGPQEIHDKSRKYPNKTGTFNDVKRALELIKKHPEGKKLSCLISAVGNPQYDYKDYSNFFSNSPLVKDIDITFNTISPIGANVKPTTSQEFLRKQEYEKALYYLYKLGKISSDMVPKLGAQLFQQVKDIHKKLKYIGRIGEIDQHSGPCIPGRQKLFVNAHGRFFPCEKVNENSPAMCIGDIENGFDYVNLQKALNLGQVTEEECKNCWAFRFCTICLLFADDGTNNLSHDALIKECAGVRERTHRLLLEYCALRELGFDFEIESEMENYECID